MPFSHRKHFAELLTRFLAHQQLVNTYAEAMYRQLEYLPGHPLETNHNTVVFKLPIGVEYNNFHGSAHGGSLATLLDISTTLALFKLNQAKTTSVEMSMSYLSPAKIGEPVLVRAEALRFGSRLCYS